MTEMPNKHRAKGDWQKIANQRAHKERFIRTSRGVTNIPRIGEVGSAAYQRTLTTIVGKKNA
jgi:hypothetical protein